MRLSILASTRELHHNIFGKRAPLGADHDTMLFNSFTFILFFVVVLAIYSLPLPWWLKKLHLLVASYLFYAAWNPPFVLLLVAATVVDWLLAGAMGRARSPSVRRLLLLFSVASNLGMLGYFKYAETFLQYFEELMATVGVAYRPPAGEWDIVLPLGISFYTFQTLSYTIDVYRGTMKPWPSLIDFSLFVAFFPQLVAGPIVRAHHFLSQCVEPKRATADQFGWGLCLLVLGLFMKIVLADGLFAPVVNTVFTPGLSLGPSDAWTGSLAFVGQLYCDFAGYSTCAVGLAACLGFAIPANFHFPLAMIGVADFWRRWHISLSTWLHDYVFAPLGGYQRRKLRTTFNVMLTMTLCGLWHGPTLNFLIFGVLNGVYVAFEYLIRRTWLHRLALWRTPLGKAALWALTFFLLTFTLIFFRAQNFDHATSIAASMFGLGRSYTSYLSDADLLFALVPLEVMIVLHFLLRNSTLEEAVAAVPWWIWSIALGLMLAGIALVPGTPDDFIYFQF